MEDKQNNFFPYFASISVNLLTISAAGGFSWTSPSIPKLESSDPEINPLGKPITLFEESCIAAIYPISCSMGALISGVVAEYLGRKKTLLSFGIPMVTCFVIISVAKTVPMLYVARILHGLGSGAVFAVLPSYVGEISKDHNRGVLEGFMGITAALGHMLNYVIGAFVSVRVFCFIHLIPLILLYLTYLPFVPESPYYLVSSGKETLALESLKKFRGESIGNSKKELTYIQERIEESKRKTISFWDTFKSKTFKKGLMVCCGLMIIQQCGGFGAVTSYMQNIFEASGTSIPAEISPIPVSGLVLLANIITIFFVDRIGRRPLLLLSVSGMILSLWVLGTFFYLKTNGYNIDSIYWLPLCSIATFITSFNIGLDSLPWTMSGELFSSEFKSIGTSISCSVCFATMSILTMLFNYMELVFGMAGCFWILSVGPFCGIIFITFIVPETKGKSHEEIQHILEGEYETVSLA